MRRIALSTLLLIIAASAALVISTVAQGSDSYKFDVIFDDARGLVSGQEVKIAGAEAGEITNVVVTSNDKARVEAKISGPFQMHTNATCIIRPDGLIGENYVDCNPGTGSKPLLKASGGNPPTVPVSQTSEPVELLDLFDIFNLPTRERFQALLDELGITTAGDGDQINEIVQRANPTLVAAQHVIAILDRQDTEIADEIDNTNTLAQSGAAHIADVQAFLKQGAALTQLTSDHSSPLEQTIHKLPGFLAASTPAMKQLNTVAVDGTPLLASIHTAVPYLNRVDTDIVPFTKLAQPALANLSQAVSTAIPDLKLATPVVKTISNYLSASRPTTAEFAGLVDDLIDHGFSENFLSVLYYVANSLSKYDTDSHMLSTYLIFPGAGLCGSYATTPVAACNAHYGQNASYTPSRSASQPHTAAAHTPRSSGTTGTTPQPGAGSSSTRTAPSTNLGSNLGGTLSNLGSTLSSGVSNLAGTSTGTVGKIASGLAGSSSANSSQDSDSQTSTSSLSNLLGYLLK